MRLEDLQGKSICYACFEDSAHRPSLGSNRYGAWRYASIGAEVITPKENNEESIVAAARDVDAIVTCWLTVSSEAIAAAPNCRIVARLGIGLDNIDVAYATDKGIPVTNVPDYCLTEVAEHSLALVMALARNVAHYHLETKSGRYERNGTHSMQRIEDQTLGIVGLGAIGSLLAKKAQGIGMRVVATSRTNTRGQREDGIEWRTLNELLGESDYVSLNLPLNDETRRLMGTDQFALMKPSAFLINTSRGGLVDHAALAAALEQGQLAGAALDVQDPEPPDLGQPPFNDPRVIVTPHAAFLTVESLANLRNRVLNQVIARLSGETPENVVNSVPLG